MDEKKETKEEQDKPTENDEAGVQSEATTDLDRADEIVERRNRVAEREEKILDRKEAFAARQAVGGVTEAGQSAPEKKPETDEEFVEKVKKGEVNLMAENVK